MNSLKRSRMKKTKGLLTTKKKVRETRFWTDWNEVDII